MLSFAAPTTESSLLTSFKRERALHRYATRVVECTSASLIIPRLYLSNYRIAADEHELADMGITHVVSVLEVPPEYTGTEFTRLHVAIEDTMQSNILDHLPTTTEFIRAALAESENNKVLVRACLVVLRPGLGITVAMMADRILVLKVHCVMGISRSATVVCAYLVATTSMNATEAIEYVQERRSVACPNLGFRHQLEKYTDELIENGIKPDTPVPSIMEKVTS